MGPRTIRVHTCALAAETSLVRDSPCEQHTVGVTFIHLLAHSCIQYLLTTYYVPGTVLDSWNSSVDQTDTVFLFWELVFWF